MYPLWSDSKGNTRVRRRCAETMIVKMKFLTITAHKRDIDRICDQYLSKYEIQLENALSELKTVDNLLPFIEVNPFKDSLDKANQFANYIEDDVIPEDKLFSQEEMFSLIRDMNQTYMNFRDHEEELRKQQEHCREVLRLVEPFRSIDFSIHDVTQYRFIKFRFGRVPVDYYHKLEKYVYEDLDVVFIEGSRDASHVYGVYFSAEGNIEQTDAILKSLHFERLRLPDEYEGTTREVCRQLTDEINRLNQEILSTDIQIREAFKENGSKLLAVRDRLQKLSSNFDVRKLAALVENKRGDHFILCGWMPEDQAALFMEEIKKDPDVFVIVEDNHEEYFSEPPTKLKNPKFFKPFEMFIKMYGLPAHNELDPTIFVALTYTFIFGAMFGDVGQGLCLFLGGAILYKWKKINLAGIVSIAGIFSTFFGFMFGSVFGFENIIEATWIRPISHMTTLPFIGKLNTVFIVAVAFGMGIILLSMIFHIINAKKAHDTEALLDQNGISGLVFYGAVVLTVVLFMTGNKLPATIVLVVMFGIPLLLMIFKEPITSKLEKRIEHSQEGKVMFVVQAVFEMFETLLSYFSNTLSFVRIGAFAVSHAAMMEVVLMLAGVETGNPNWAVVVGGNLFVCAMEGLIVGIQVLRLEYYEMFSRFYKGTGREFKPYN